MDLSEEFHFSELCPINDHCPIPNLHASAITVSVFAKHSSLLPFLSQEMSLNIDINRFLFVKVSGDCPQITQEITDFLLQSCNVVNPWNMFHSTSVDSPVRASKSL